LICAVLVFLENVKGTSTMLRLLQNLLVIFLMLFVGFRLVGPDYWTYRDMYKTVRIGNAASLESIIEPFFIYLMKFFTWMNADVSYYTFFVAACSIGIKVRIIREYSPYFYLSILLALMNYIFADMGQMRFMLAISTTWLSIPYYENKQWWKFYLVIAIAASMHTSAWIFGVVFFIDRFNFKFATMLTVWICCYGASYIADNTIVGSIIDDYAKDTMIDTKFDIYSTGARQYIGRVGYGMIGTALKVFNLYLLSASTMTDRRMHTFFYNSYFIGGCLFFFFGFNEIMSLRLSMYFFAMEVLFIPIILYYIKDKMTFWILLFVFVLKSWWQLDQIIYVKISSMWLPYSNYLERFI
jgi:hypothetical protein